MDNMEDSVQKDLVNELAQGREIAVQLNQLLNVPSSLSDETRDMMVEKIIASFEKTLAMIHSTGSSMSEQSDPTRATFPMMSESSPLSFIPRNEESDRDFRDHEQQVANCNNSKKNLPKWTRQSRVSPETGLQGPTDDGYSWRKYGQKDILGAKHPRAYYRCTHRDVRGCLATKHVQRSDADHTIFNITYRGQHTCSHSSNMNNPSASVENQETTDRDIFHQQQENVMQQQLQQSEQMLVSFREALSVQTENLDTYYQTTPSFNFPTDFQPDSPVFFPSIQGTNLVGNFSHSYISDPVTSGVNHFPVSPNGMNSFGENNSLPSSESEINDKISAATSAANSPTIGLDYPFGHVEFEPNFSFNKPGFLS